jgi:3-oxoacyl-[acyl-carrier protein] reductase
MNMKIDFSGQTVLVTGATRGIGKQIADDLADLGAKLILTGTNKRTIEKLNQSSDHNTVKYYCVDFTDIKSTRRFIAEISAKKKIDVCINNAGINKIDFLEDARPQDWDEILAVNLTAPFMITRAVSKIMKKNGYGRIVNISSIFGVISKAKRSIYSATKSGLNGLSRAAANELAQYNVLVNSVSPGFVLTDLTRGILSAKEIKDLAKQIPLQRFARPDEISRLVLFVASDLNTYLTGQNIIIDGGFVNV